MTKNNPEPFLVTAAQAGQRIDNFLLNFYKGVPKSRIYRALRHGEVRINGKRIKPVYRLKLDDQIRLPPLRMGEKVTAPKLSDKQLQELATHIIYEDESLIILNKPAGLAVHGGSGINFGVIESIRQLRPQAKFLELVHRLDRDTSGCLMIAKKRAMLVLLHEALRTNKIKKVYLALVKGEWQGGTRKVSAALVKNQLQSGERMVHIDEEQGKPSISVFEPLQKFTHATLMKITLHTGRTHQIRVHAAHIGHPIAGDEKYGDKGFNKEMRHLGLKRLFLHAAELRLYEENKKIAICASLDPMLVKFILDLRMQLFSLKNSLQKAQSKVQKYGKNQSLVNKLSTMRKEDSSNE